MKRKMKRKGKEIGGMQLLYEPGREEVR